MNTPPLTLAVAILCISFLTGCACSDPPVPAEVAESVEGENLTVGSSTVNGLKMKAISCKTDGGLLTPITMQAGLAKQREALEACTDKPAAIRIGFEFDGGNPTNIAVADAPGTSEARCVRDALAVAALVGRGKCVMTLDLPGKK
jgi:hypothetical protein